MPNLMYCGVMEACQSFVVCLGHESLINGSVGFVSVLKVHSWSKSYNPKRIRCQQRVVMKLCEVQVAAVVLYYLRDAAFKKIDFQMSGQ